MSYSMNIFVVAGLFLVYSIMWFVAAKMSPSRKQGFNISNTFLLFGTVFLILSMFSLMSGAGYATEYANNATCEDLITNTSSTWNNVTNTTTVNYTYADSCVDRGRYTLGDNLLIVFIWTSFLMVFAAGFGLIWIIGRWVSVW